MKTFDSITMSRQVGCGNVYVIFVEEDGAFNRCFIKGDNAKESPCGESWMNAMASILTFSLRKSIWEGNTQKAIVKHLLNHRCNMATPNQEHIVSCSDAIGRCVLEYLKARNLDELESAKEKEEAKV